MCAAGKSTTLNKHQRREDIEIDLSLSAFYTLALRPFESVEKLRHGGTTLTNQNYVHDEINSRLNFGNTCCHSVP
jgi:hypothetical protein